MKQEMTGFVIDGEIDYGIESSRPWPYYLVSIMGPDS